MLELPIMTTTHSITDRLKLTILTTTHPTNAETDYIAYNTYQTLLKLTILDTIHSRHAEIVNSEPNTLHSKHAESDDFDHDTSTPCRN
jgi:hypothetical protein